MIEKLTSQLLDMVQKKKINLIIFGETHSFLEDEKIQKEVIKIFQPDIFFYEMLEETELLSENQKEDFLNEPDEKEFSVISTFGELKKTIALAKKYNIPIIGNDIKNMCRENKEFLQKTNLTQEELKNEEFILKKREIQQTKKILDFIEKDKKIFLTTGAFHLRKDSLLRNLNLNKPYLIIYFAYKGEQLFEPPEDFDIKEVSIKIEEIS